MKKNITLKYVRFKAGRKKDFVAPSLESLIAKIMAKTKSVGERHLPDPSQLSIGCPCLFLNAITEHPKRDGVMLSFCSYTYGINPELFSPDLSSKRASIATSQVLDSNGKPKQLACTYRALVFGQSLLLETVRGGGGIDQLANLLSWLIQTYCDSDLPSVELLDVTGTKLQQAIDAGGGVAAMELRMVDGSTTADWYSQRLADLRKKVPGTQHLSVRWDAGDTALSAAEVARAFKEYDAGDDGAGLDNIVVFLKNGGKIDRLHRYRERREVDIETVGSSNRPNIQELKIAMRNYLDELRRPLNGWRLINDDGNFVNPQRLKTKG